MSRFSVYSIGRSPDSDIVIEHPSVSSSHAELVVTADGRYYLNDCNSSGGTAFRKSSNDPWEKTRQGYVGKTDALLLGSHVTSVQELLTAIKEFKGKGNVVSEPSSRDELPDGPVRRDAITGEILSQED